MSVPEASMDDDDGVMLCENKVGRAWKIALVQAITEAGSMQGFADQQFRFRVCASDAAHIPLPLFWRLNCKIRLTHLNI